MQWGHCGNSNWWRHRRQVTGGQSTVTGCTSKDSGSRSGCGNHGASNGNHGDGRDCRLAAMVVELVAGLRACCSLRGTCCGYKGRLIGRRHKGEGRRHHCSGSGGRTVVGDPSGIGTPMATATLRLSSCRSWAHDDQMQMHEREVAGVATIGIGRRNGRRWREREDSRRLRSG